MKNETNLLEGPIVKPLLSFFFPVLLGTFFQQLYNTVDAMVVGNYVGKQALGAVGGSTGTLINLLVGFITGISSGATVIVAQYYGNRDLKGVKKSVSSSMSLSIILGILMSFAGIVFAPNLLRLMEVPDDVYPLSLSYMRIYMIGLVPSLIYNSGAGILRAVGDSKRPLWFLIISCFVNIIFDVILVCIIPLGVNGAALATVLSQIVSCVLTLLVFKQSNAGYHYELKDSKIDVNILKRILLIGLPTGIQSCLYSFSNLFIQVGINRYGTDTIAAYTAFGKIDSLFWMVSGAFGTAVLTFIGQNFGALKIERVKRAFKLSLLIDLIISASLALIIYLISPYLFTLFTNDQAVIDIGMSMLSYLCPFWCTFIFVEVFSSGIRACGDSLMTMLITAMGIGVFRILWILFVPSNNIFELLRSYPVSWILTSIIFIIYYLQGGWLKRSLKAREKMLAK